ncbi:MAG: hypothetical protein JSS66_11540 [Armatimonadetes bacterium]|nr:hypothetical protein [Armatimonadota bacterium]
MDIATQRRVARLLMWGAIAFGLGLGLWFVFLGAGNSNTSKQVDPMLYVMGGVSILLVVGGTVAAGLGLGIGWKHALSDDTSDEPREFPGTSVLTLLEGAAAGADPSVQIRLSDGNCKELQLDPGLFSTLGEGMRGTATIKGHRLIGFVRPS